MKRLAFILILICMMPATYSQSTFLWSRDFTAGLKNYFTRFPSIQTQAGTIKVIGTINTADGQRLAVVNYDLKGNTVLSKNLGADAVSKNAVTDYKIDAAGHIYILQKDLLGFYKSKIVLQKYSPDGNLMWAQQIQNPADTSYLPHSLGIANDTCIFIAAYEEFNYPEAGDDVFFTVSHPCLYAFNAAGKQLWKRRLDANTEIDRFSYRPFVYNSTAFLFAYNKNLVKVDIHNNLTVNSMTGLLNGIGNVQLTPDTNLLITAGFSRYRISKTDLNGKFLWTYDHGTNLPGYVFADEILATVQDAQGNIYFTGRHYGLNYGTPDYTNADIVTVKCGSSGNLIWQYRFAFAGDNADIGNAIQLKNGYVYVGGQSERLGLGTDYDYAVLKIDTATGSLAGGYKYNGPAGGDDVVTSLAVFDNGNIALTGLSFNGSQYNWTTQLLSDIKLIDPNPNDDSLHIFPNPLLKGEILTILGKGFTSYAVISTLGQIVQQGSLSPNANNTIRLCNSATGVVVLRLHSDKGITTHKIIVI